MLICDVKLTSGEWTETNDISPNINIINYQCRPKSYNLLI